MKRLLRPSFDIKYCLLKNDIQVKSDHIVITLLTYQSFSVVKSEQSAFKDKFKESHS